MINLEDTPYRKNEEMLSKLMDDINNSNYEMDTSSEHTVNNDDIDQVIQDALLNENDSINIALTQPASPGRESENNNDNKLNSSDHPQPHSPSRQLSYQHQQQISHQINRPQQFQQQFFEHLEQSLLHNTHQSPQRTQQYHQKSSQQPPQQSDNDNTNIASSEPLSPHKKSPLKTNYINHTKMKAKGREQTLEQVINEALSPSRVKRKNNDNDSPSINDALMEALSPNRKPSSNTSWSHNNEGTINETTADHMLPSPVKTSQNDPGRTPAVDHWEDRPEAHSPTSISSNDLPPPGPLHDI
jgi:hypothetical protein